MAVVHTYRTQPRAPKSELNWTFDGLWDIGAVTVALTRPIVRNTLFRDGRVASETTHAGRRQTTWGGSDAPMCHGWLLGFAYGGADGRQWAGDADRAALKVHRPAAWCSFTPAARCRRAQHRRCCRR